VVLWDWSERIRDRGRGIIREDNNKEVVLGFFEVVGRVF